MGFRSKLMTEDYQGMKVPEWFLSKYPSYHYAWQGYSPVLSFSSRTESKFYEEFIKDERFTDIQKVLEENEFTGTISVVLLHECGGITLVFISKDKIYAREPVTWKEVKQAEHNYCHGCSELPTKEE